MRGCFVRLLFGDQLIDGYDGLMNDLANREKDTFKPEPLHFAVFGQFNWQLVQVRGFRPLLLSREAVPGSECSDSRDAVSGFGVRPHGRNLYYLKFAAILDAMNWGYDDVVFLDLDVYAIKLIPENFWGRLRQGREIQAPLVQYHRSQCFWRKRFPRTSIYCATTYFRGMDVVQRCLDFAERHPLEYEQAAINHTIDELMGGEMETQAAYKEAGFEFPFTCRRGGMIFEPEDPVFSIGSKGWSQWKKKGIKAWEQHVRELSGGSDTSGMIS